MKYWMNMVLLPKTAISLILPDSYEIYWNTDAMQYVERMAVERDQFWASKNRIAKAKKKETDDRGSHHSCFYCRKRNQLSTRKGPAWLEFI